MHVLFGNVVTTWAMIAAGAASCAIAASIDVRTRRVPNWLTACTIVLALVLAAAGGIGSLVVACAIVAGGFAVGMLAHASGLLGGGDVKLLIGVAALVGFPNCLLLLLYTALAGGALALIVSAARGQLRVVLQRTSSQIFALLTCKRVLAQPQDRARGHERLPYAVAIAAGFALLILSQTCLPAIRITL